MGYRGRSKRMGLAGLLIAGAMVATTIAAEKSVYKGKWEGGDWPIYYNKNDGNVYYRLWVILLPLFLALCFCVASVSGK